MYLLVNYPLKDKSDYLSQKDCPDSIKTNFSLHNGQIALASRHSLGLFYMGLTFLPIGKLYGSYYGL